MKKKFKSSTFGLTCLGIIVLLLGGLIDNAINEKERKEDKDELKKEIMKEISLTNNEET